VIAPAPARLGAVALLAASACATVRSSGEGEPEAQKAPPLADFFQTRRYGTAISLGMTFSHDDKLAAFQSDAGGRLDLWVKPLDGGPARQITHVEGFVGNFAFSPTDDVLAYEADVGGDELPHLFLTDSKGTAPRDVTADYPKGRRTAFVEWAPDGRTFLYQSNLRDESLLDLYEYDLATGRSQLVWKASGAISFAVADREHKRFALLETLSDKNTNLYLFERGGGEPVLLTPHQGDVLYAAQDFTKDGALLFTSDQGSEFSGLYSIDLPSKAITPVFRPSWDVDTAGESLEHRYRVVAVNADGTEQLTVGNLASGSDVKVQPAPLGGGWLPAAFSPGERWLGVWLRTDAVPQTPYAIDLQTGEARKLDEPLPASLRNYPMAVGQSVRIPSFDGKPVPAYFYKPQGKGPFPAVIDVHGGPTAQSRRMFSPFRQYLVSRGIAVLVPNVRGSTGYGKTWTALDDRDLGGGPLKDVVACKWWMVGNAGVSDDKVVVMGGSYGGYMALAAEAFASDEFAANLDFFGVSDLKTLVESFPPYWASAATYIYEKFGDPKNPKDAQYQHDRSPIWFTDRMKSPLLVVQGDKDVRVRKEQSDRIVEALRKRNVPVYYLVLENEGHGFSRNDDMLRAFDAADRFLRKFVLGDASVQVLP
jgi:dipeptidyl aminopeptidase/acylaminoacyl peptidase